MATVTLTSPENGATGVGNIIVGKAWVSGLFTVGESGEPWGTGDCSGWESYLDGQYHASSQGWKSGSQSASLGGLDYYSEHTWQIKIIVRTDEQGSWEKISSPIWSFTTGGPPANVRSAFLDSVGVTIVAATEDGIYVSFDSGDNWAKKRPDGVAETDWEKVICSYSGVYIIAVSSANAIYRSATGGAGWAAITPAGGDTFSVNKIAMSDDGQFVVIVGANTTDLTKSCYLSTDYGATWTAVNPTDVSVIWTDCAISNDGTVIGVSSSGYFEVSFDSGATWRGQTVAATAENWGGLSISGDGTVGLVSNLSTNNEFFIGTKTEIYSEATWAESTLTSAGRALLDDATAAAQATTIGVGTGDSPEFVGLTLSGLTATRLLASDESKVAVSSDLVTWVAGTANEINITDDGDGSITVGLVDPVIVAKGGTGATTLIDHGILLGSGTAAVTPLGEATNGQLPIGSTGADPVLATLTGTSDHLTVSNGAGSIVLDLGANTQTILDAFNGIFLETIDFTISESGGTVTGSLEKDGTGDLTQRFSDGYSTLDCTPVATINLTAYVGTDAVPKEVFVYILQSAKTTMAASNSDWPATEHIKIANLVLRSVATTGTDGALVNRNWNDHAQDSISQGHITHIEQRLRQNHAEYKSGVALTLKNAAGAALTTGNSSTAVELVTSAGAVYQLHKQTFPAVDMYTTATDDAHIANQPTNEGGAYETTVALVTDVTHYTDGSAAGVAIGANKYFNLVVWGVQNRSGEKSHLMINLPTGQYTVEANATSDINGTSIYDIPSAFKGAGFLIARLTFRLIAGPQWTYIAQEDLRGQFPGTSAGVGVSTTDHAILSNLAFASAGHTGFQAQGDVLDDLNILGAVSADNEVLIGTGAGVLAWESGNTLRTSIGLAIGTDVQAYDAGLLSLAGLTYVSDSFIKVTATDTYAIRTLTETRTDLGLAIGTNVQAWDAGLDSLAGLGYVSDSMIKITAADTYAIRTMAEVRTDLGLVIGTNVQAYDAELTSLAALTYVAASFVKMTGANTFTLRTIGETADDLEGTIDHDSTANYDANKHIDHTGVTLSAGSGIAGGGDISANRSFALDINSLAAAAIAAGDFVPFWDITAVATNKKITFANFEAALNHDSLTGFVANEHLDWTQDLGATNIHAGNYSNTQLTQEQVEDFAGALVAAGTGTHTGIAITYQDGTGDIDFVVDHDAANNFVADEHIAHSRVTLTAGKGLSGGGDISAGRSFALALTEMTGNVIWDDGGTDASITWTYALSGANDPVWTIGANSMDLTTGVLKVGGTTVMLVGGAPTAHTIASHSDTTGTGAELNTLTGGGDVGALHTHAAAYQPLDADLTSLAALGSAGDKMAYTTAANTWAETALTAAGRAILDDANAAAQQATLGLVIGTNVQAYDAGLLSLAGLAFASASFIKMTAGDTYAVRTIAETADDLETAIDHDNLANGGAHNYAYITGNDGATDVTAAELETLTDGSATALHSHAAAGAHAILDGNVHTDSVADGVTRGSIIYGNATPKWDELVIGAADTFLGSDGADLSYRTAAQVLASLSGEAAAAFDLNGQDLINGGVLFLTEQAAAEADVAGKGQVWVKTGAPNTLWFTDEDGTDTQLGAGGGAHTHDGDTLQLDGVNSDGGAFSFTTTGLVTFNQSINVAGTATLGDLLVEDDAGGSTRPLEWFPTDGTHNYLEIGGAIRLGKNGGIRIDAIETNGALFMSSAGSGQTVINRYGGTGGVTIHSGDGTSSTVVFFKTDGDAVFSGNVGIGLNAAAAEVADYPLEVNGGISVREKSADPTEPEEGKAVVWLSDGTGFGDDGDVCISGKAGGVVRTTTLFDHSGGGVGSGYLGYIKLSDVQAQNTGGGTFTQGAWRTRTLNTEDMDTNNDCTLNANQITLTAGTYECLIRCPAHDCGRHQARLYNTTGAAVLILGTSEFIQANTNHSFIAGRFTIAGSQALEVQHYCDTTKADRGFGVEANITSEIYAIAEFRRVS